MTYPYVLPAAEIRAILLLKLSIVHRYHFKKEEKKKKAFFFIL